MITSRAVLHHLFPNYPGDLDALVTVGIYSTRNYQDFTRVATLDAVADPVLPPDATATQVTDAVLDAARATVQRTAGLGRWMLRGEFAHGNPQTQCERAVTVARGDDDVAPLFATRALRCGDIAKVTYAGTPTPGADPSFQPLEGSGLDVRVDGPADLGRCLNDGSYLFCATLRDERLVFAQHVVTDSVERPSLFSGASGAQIAGLEVKVDALGATIEQMRMQLDTITQWIRTRP